MKDLWSQVNDLWCSVVHGQPMWPIHGHYRCRVCDRLHPIHWEKRSENRANLLA
jgi:hypothetical protein